MHELAEQLQGAHAITATVIAKDLAAPRACDELVADLGERGIQLTRALLPGMAWSSPNGGEL